MLGTGAELGLMTDRSRTACAPGPHLPQELPLTSCSSHHAGDHFRNRAASSLQLACKCASLEGGTSSALPEIMGKRRPTGAREALTERRRILTRRAEGTLADERRLLEDVEPDWEDQAATLNAVMLLDRMSDVDLMQLRKVQAALDRLDEGTYGRCVRCRRPIERARLRTLPETERCSTCADTN